MDIKKISRFVLFVVVSAHLNAETKIQPHHKKNKHQRHGVMHWKTIGEVWINTTYASGGESYILLSRAKDRVFGPTRILGKQANAQPKTAANISIDEDYVVYIKKVQSFNMPVGVKGAAIEYTWVPMDALFNAIQAAATTNNFDGVTVEDRNGRIIVLDKKFVEAFVNDFDRGKQSVLFSYIDLTRPSEVLDVQEYAG